MKKYLQLSAQLRNQIEQRQFRPGEQLPSIRNLSEQTKMSKNTVIRAYMLLEDEGLIEPHNRSGFVVRNSQPGTTHQSPPRPREVKLGAMALSVIRAAGDPNRIALGSAHPGIQFPACRQFYRLLARHAHQQANSQQKGGHYTTPPGSQALRERIARRLSLQGHTLSADEIVITNGAMEAISLSLLSVAKAGDIIIVEKPAYYGNLNCIEALGMKVLEIPCEPDTGMDLQVLTEAMQQWPVTAMLLNPTFNNPMGFSMPVENRKQLLKLASKYHIPIIEDDTFGELYFGKAREPSLKQLDQHDLVIHCSSLSKTLNSDIRIGWAVAGRYYDQLTYMKYVSSLASPGVIQAAAADFLADNQYERHLRRVRRHYLQAKQQIIDAIYQHWPSEVSLSQPAGGFLLWCRLPEGVDGDAIYRQAAEQGINIAPGSLFSCDGELRNHIRLNFATWEQSKEYRESIESLGHLIQQAMKSPDTSRSMNT